MKNPIIKEKVRIFRPDEYTLLRSPLKLNQQTWLDAMLNTGMRYEELKEFQKNPKWFDGDFINLPEGAEKKGRKVGKRKNRTRPERSIRLTPQGKTIIKYFLRDKKVPTRTGMNANLKRWCVKAELDPKGVSIKTFRKTWESWLVFYYPVHFQLICLSQGHTPSTSSMYYLNMPFTDSDKEGMKSWVEGWV